MQGQWYLKNVNNVIRKISTDGEVSTYAGTGQHWGDGDVELTSGNKLERSLSRPYSVKINGSFMYVVERDAHQISRINMSRGVLSRYVGKRHENGDDNGNETEAKFNGPRDIAFDSSNNMLLRQNFTGIGPFSSTTTVEIFIFLEVE